MSEEKELTDQKIKEVRGTNFNAGNLLNCSFCKRLETLDQITKIKSNKYACESCYDPADPEQNESEEGEIGENNVEIDKSEAKTSNYSFANTNTSESEKDKQKAKEILNIEELNNKVEIPKELNIIDCPPDVNSNKEWFRIQFKNFWRLFHDDSE